MHEFSLVHKMNEFDHASNEYVDLVCMKILLIIYDKIHIHVVMKNFITPTLGR